MYIVPSIHISIFNDFNQYKINFSLHSDNFINKLVYIFFNLIAFSIAKLVINLQIA